MIWARDQEQESGRTTIRSNPSDACFQHFLFICLHRRIPLGVTSVDLNWLAREQGFASHPSGSASGTDLFYIRFRHPVTRGPARDARRPLRSSSQKTTRIRYDPTPSLIRVLFRSLLVYSNRTLASLTHGSVYATISTKRHTDDRWSPPSTRGQYPYQNGHA